MLSNCNHSGSTGWDSSLFELVENGDHGSTLYTERTDRWGGFPGNLKIWISYPWKKQVLQSQHKVTTDQDTLVNPTNHSYFLVWRFHADSWPPCLSAKYGGRLPSRSGRCSGQNSRYNRRSKHINGALLRISLQKKMSKSRWYLVWITHCPPLQAMTMLVFLMTKIQVASYFSRQGSCFVVYTAWMRVSSPAGQPMIQLWDCPWSAGSCRCILVTSKDQVILKVGQTFTSKTRYGKHLLNKKKSWFQLFWVSSLTFISIINITDVIISYNKKEAPYDLCIPKPI